VWIDGRVQGCLAVGDCTLGINQPFDHVQSPKIHNPIFNPQ
jgi:hypothetical protein